MPVLAILVYGPFAEALVLLWIAILIYGAHTFLTVVQETAAGCDVVNWPGDPWTDRLGSLFFLTTVAGLWAVPLFVLWWAGYLELNPRHVILGMAAYLWLLFPISLLSSLSAGSPLVLFRPVIVWRLLKRLPTLVAFYLATAFVLTMSLGVFGIAIFLSKVDPPDVPGTDWLSWLFDLALLVGTILLLPVAAVLAAAGLLIYARLLGRLGLLLNRLDARPQEGQDQAVTDEAPAPLSAATEESTQVLQSAAESGTLTPQLASEETYALLTETPPSDVTTRPAPAPTDLIAALPPESAHRQKAALAMRQTAPSPLELRLSRGRRLPEPPRWLLFSGVYSFPFYRTNWRALATLSLGNLVAGVVLYLIVRLLPN
jgi:hypothetical protein